MISEEEKNELKNKVRDELIETHKQNSKPKLHKLGWACFVFLLLGIGFLLFLKYTLVRTFIVSGSSMEPTYENNAYIIANSLSYVTSEPKNGDVIVFKFPEDVNQDFVKRIIGIPGDVVKIKNGKVFVNDQELNEPYINGKYTYGDKEVILRENEYFVLGDNREPNASEDSRIWGVLNRDLIIGKVWKQL